MAAIRVLQIVPAMNCGGLESFIMNIYRKIDRRQVQFDFLVHYTAPSYFDAEIAALGGRIYRLCVREDNNLPRYLHALNTFFAQHPEYAVIHGHYSGFGMFYNAIAKKHGVRVRIGHSHSTASEKNIVGLLDFVMSLGFNHNLTDRFACSEEAGRFLFHGKAFTVIANGIDTAHFIFTPQKRAQMRVRLHLSEDAVVYGHVGRFEQPKNHKFLLEIFAEIIKRQPHAILLLAGDGSLQNECRTWCAAHDLTQQVRFLGTYKDTAELYLAMDGFLFPSLFEGLPVVLVEAQAAGLPCLVSNRVSQETAVTDLVQFLPLEAGAPAWAEKAISLPTLQRKDFAELVAKAGFDAATQAYRLQQFYLQKAAEFPREVRG